MEYLMRILIFSVSARASLLGVFFASFSSCSDLSIPDGGIIRSLASGLVTAGDSA
jgi:hypothetical protein